MTDYTDIMQKALAARKSMSGGKTRIGSSFKRSNSSQSPLEQPDIKAVNPMHQWNMEDAKEDQAQANVEKTEALTEYTKAQTDTEKGDTPLAKANLKAKKLANMSQGLKNIASYANVVTAETYEDLYNWAVVESDFIPEGVLEAPDAVRAMKPLEQKVYFSNMASMGDTSISTISKMHDIKLKQDKEKRLQEAQAAKEKTEQEKAALKKKENLIKSAENFVKRWDNKDSVPPDKLPQYEKAEAIIQEALGVEPPPEVIEGATPAQTKIMTSLGNQAQIGQAQLEEYKKMYPDKTEEEIFAAYKAMLAKQGVN